MERWIGIVDGRGEEKPVSAGAGEKVEFGARHRMIVDRPVDMARRGVGENVDADVQIALGVLLNMTEVCSFLAFPLTV